MGISSRIGYLERFSIRMNAVETRNAQRISLYG
jgi:hypothetical protein